MTRPNPILSRTAAQEHPPPINPTMLRQLRRQQGRCPICTELLLTTDNQPHSPQEWE
jgi:RNA-directed DNA polymerase